MGSAVAFTRTDLLAGRVPSDAVGRAVTEAFHPRRSGQVRVVQAPYGYLYNEAEEFAAMHGSPYACDTRRPAADRRSRRGAGRNGSPPGLAA